MDNIYLEKEVEKLKITLAEMDDFTHTEAWNLFDISNTRQMDQDDFI